MTDQKNKIYADTFVVNTLILGLLVIALSIQVLIMVTWVWSFIPFKPSPLIANLFLRHQALVVLKRDISLYHFFIAAAIGLQAGGVFLLRPQLEKKSFTRPLLFFTLAEYGLCLLMVFAVFKMFVYGFAPWTKVIFYLALGLSILSKIFWKELSESWSPAVRCWEKIVQTINHQRWIDLSFCLFILLILYIPDIHGLLAQMFMTDHLNHFDGTIMGSAWVHHKGGILDVDQYTIYSIGFPTIMGDLAQLAGGFSYTSMVTVMVLGTAFYYIAAYALARFWLKSIVLAMAMVLLLIKWQVFHPGVAPIIFNYPSATIWRYPLDILFLFLLLSHLRTCDFRLLIAAGVLCGFSFFYEIDTGVYMAVAYAFYVLSHLIMDLQDASVAQARKKVLKAVGLLLIIPLVALLCLAMTQGQHLFTLTFWENLTERSVYFVIGYGALPITKSLLEGKYLESFMGFFIPCVYTLVLVVTSTLLFLRKASRETLFISTLCIYGLASYHYYICRSADTSYYVVALPFVFILGYLLKVVIRYLPDWRKPLLGGCLALALFSLATNHWFLDYPNLLNFSKNPFTHPVIPMKVADGLSFFNHNDMMWPAQLKLSANSLGESDEELKTESDFADDGQLKDFFDREFDFSKDAALIAGLTAKDEKVPLISSFETRILMQANRAPFFYYFPFVDPRPMHMRMFDMTELWAVGRLKRTMQQLVEKHPPYIFMERIMLAQSVPQYYEYLYPDLLVILNYIHQNYVPYKQGHYLVAMKYTGAHE